MTEKAKQHKTKQGEAEKQLNKRSTSNCMKNNFSVYRMDETIREQLLSYWLQSGVVFFLIVSL